MRLEYASGDNPSRQPLSGLASYPHPKCGRQRNGTAPFNSTCFIRCFYRDVLPTFSQARPLLKCNSGTRPNTSELRKRVAPLQRIQIGGKQGCQAGKRP